ncbi:MAG TPA: hypothetical protein VFT41_10555 [Gemmatimonadaceae bacterium]|nr:hypothetical protein [Gemmatimonadaceae bacterium]
MPQKIITVGFNIPGDDYESVDIDSDRSLLDADIILFEPHVPESYYGYSEAHYQGKPTLSQSGSFKAVEHATHWRSELKAALEDGKTVIVYLARPTDVFVYTGKKEYSGTGRNQKVTNMVRPFSSYETLPLLFGSVTPKSGSEIKVVGDLGALAEYWRAFGNQSPYQVYFEGNLGKVILTTKTGGRAVGTSAVVKKGHLILLPPLQYDEDAFTRVEDEEEYWNDDGLKFGAQLAGALLRLDAALRGDRNASPPPKWVASASYRLEREAALEREIGGVSTTIETLKAQREALQQELERETILRRLLFATGLDLEEAILVALRILGYTAENVTEADSEFDAVFVSPEGDRYLGEAEGKDNKALNIDKLSQLERNIQEDFARDEVNEHARGVLFGNAYRLQEPETRADFFTAKCLSGAKRSGIALVRTPDLFTAARYVRNSGDMEFAQRCRVVIRDAAGTIVSFPPVPTLGEVASMAEGTNGQQ